MYQHRHAPVAVAPIHTLLADLVRRVGAQPLDVLMLAVVTGDRHLRTANTIDTVR
jgi:hypothetical protein